MRRRLLLLVTATMSLVLLAFLLPLAVLLGDVAEDRAVNVATAGAQNLTYTVATADRAGVDLAVQLSNARSPYRISVYLADGTVLGARAPRSVAERAARNGNSFTTNTAAGTEIWTYTKDSAGAATVIRAFVPNAVRTAGVLRSRLILVAIGAGLLLIGIVVADRLATTVVRPTRELAAVSERLARGDLTARATPGGPREIAEMGVAVNHLAARIRELLAEETERIADLSHRLRTPMTSLRLEAEALESTADTERISAAVDDLQRSVTDVIAVARRRHAAAGAPVSCDAAAVVAERVAFWSVLAEDTERHVDKSIVDGPLPVASSTEDLAACVDALLGNVFAHTPDGTDFAVTLCAEESGALLVVGDAGPGLPDERTALRRGVSSAGSSGLGLDIVRRTAQGTGGSVTLGRSAAGGAEIAVRLGTALSPR